MPRPPATQQQAQPVVAASISYPGAGFLNRRHRPAQESWQKQAWGYFDEVGEFQFASTWRANVCSRAVLYVVERKDDETVERCGPKHPATQVLDEITNGHARQSAFLKAAALHLGVAGAGYLVNRAVRDEDNPTTKVQAGKGGRIWEVVGTEEITSRGDKWTITYEDGPEIVLADSDTVIPFWEPHPRNRHRAFSSAKSALPILAEIRRSDLHIQAQQDSRLTGNGILAFPSEMTIKAPNDMPEADKASTSDILTYTLVQTAMMSKEFLGTAAAQIPIALAVPGEQIQKIKHITTWTPMDDKVVTQREKSLGRLATTLDLPKEVVTGTGDMNRWGAWQVEESSVKVHIEPMLSSICAFVTTEVIQPTLKSDRFVVLADTSTLRLRPNRSKEALELYDRGQLNPRALLRETGFSPEDDMPKTEELKLWVLMQMVKASWSPDIAVEAVKSLGIDLGIQSAGDSTPREARPTPSLTDHPTQAPPEKSVEDGTIDQDGLAASASPRIACAVMLAHRALERAGNRLRTVARESAPAGCPADEVHLHIPTHPDRVGDKLHESFACAGKFSVDAGSAARAEAYVRRLLVDQRPFDFDEAVEAIVAEV